MIKFIKNKWNDPVWSKVFAGIILAVGGIVFAAIFSLGARIPFSKLWNDFTEYTSSKWDVSTFFDLSKKNYVLFWLSSGVLYIIAAVALTIQTLRERNVSFLKKLGESFVGILVCLAISFFFFWIFNFISQIKQGTWVWNYLINLAIQTLIVIAPVRRSSKKKSYR